MIIKVAERDCMCCFQVQQMAVRCLQRNVRKLLLIRSWPWWKLYTRVQPLLNVQRTEDQIKNQQAELDAIKAKVEKLEKERNEYKQAADVLEMRVRLPLNPLYSFVVIATFTLLVCR